LELIQVASLLLIKERLVYPDPDTLATTTLLHEMLNTQRNITEC